MESRLTDTGYPLRTCGLRTEQQVESELTYGARPLREDGGMVVAGADGTAILTWLLVLLAGSVKPA